LAHGAIQHDRTDQQGGEDASEQQSIQVQALQNPSAPTVPYRWF
jgi:hypothetical protein